MNYVLSVPDMSCSHCVMKISKALKDLEIKNFDVKLDEKKVYLSTNDIQKVLEKLEEIGYPATILS